MRMCTVTALGWLVANANLLAGLLGIVGSLLLAIPTWLGATLREEALKIDDMRARLKEPELLDPLVVHAIGKSLNFIRREQQWLRAGAICLLASFAIISLQAVCQQQL
jgi:hypothetical protein